VSVLIVPWKTPLPWSEIGTSTLVTSRGRLVGSSARFLRELVKRGREELLHPVAVDAGRGCALAAMER
jgi:hypothetical protein